MTSPVTTFNFEDEDYCTLVTAIIKLSNNTDTQTGIAATNHQTIYIIINFPVVTKNTKSLERSMGVEGVRVDKMGPSPIYSQVGCGGCCGGSNVAGAGWPNLDAATILPNNVCTQ